MNKNDIWKIRHLAIKAVRDYFSSRNYIEVDTPVFVTMPGTEVNLQYFSTLWIDQRQKTKRVYLRSSPEISLKKAYSDGEQRIFQVAKCFRNSGEIGQWHHPEFTMLEWYHPSTNNKAMINETLDLCREVFKAVLPYSDNQDAISSLEDIKQISCFEAFKEFANIDLIDNDNTLAQKCLEAKVPSIKKDDSFEDAFFKTMIDVIEPNLEKLGFVILHSYPGSMAALATIEDSWAQRFELYYNGIELCNSFVELMGSIENKNRITEDNKKRLEMNYEVPPIDTVFVNSFTKQLPPCCGNAMGIDRLISIGLGRNSIESIIPFRQEIFKNPFDS